MSSAGRQIITTVITSHWLRINIGKTNFAELMMVNSTKVKLTENRIGRIVVQVLTTKNTRSLLFATLFFKASLFMTIKRKLVFFFYLSPWLITRREIELSGSHAKQRLAHGGCFYSPRNFKTLQLYNQKLNMTGCSHSALRLIASLAKKENKFTMTIIEPGVVM